MCGVAWVRVHSIGNLGRTNSITSYMRMHAIAGTKYHKQLISGFSKVWYKNLLYGTSKCSRYLTVATESLE